MSDPKTHPRIRNVDGDRLTYQCGCVNTLDHPSGVMRRAAICTGHRRARQAPGKLGRDYFESLGAFSDGIPQPYRYIRELVECLGVVDAGNGYALEIGCGASMYAAYITAIGYHYTGIEPSHWAAEWTSLTYMCDVSRSRFEDFQSHRKFDLILSAHSLEHVHDAPAALRKCAELLTAGGVLYLVVPDDSDPLNPDHDWFFTESTLAHAIRSAGMDVEVITSRKRVEHENFIYCRARKAA